MDNLNSSSKDLVVAGFEFRTAADAEAARQDLKRCINLEQNLDYKKPGDVLMIYHKAIENRYFQTSVGYAYLLKIQERLKKLGIEEEKIRPIPLYQTFSNNKENALAILKGKEAEKLKNVYKSRFVWSIMINIILVILVASMIMMAKLSDVPNIVNYREAVINQYSEWEEELTERENAIKEKERELNYGTP